MGLYANNPGGRPSQPYAAAPAIELELRGFMLRVFNTMAGGLGLTGIVAYVAAQSGVYAAIGGTPLLWLVMLAPLGLALLLGLRVSQMGPAAAQAVFWGYAALMGLWPASSRSIRATASPACSSSPLAPSPAPRPGATPPVPTSAASGRS